MADGVGAGVGARTVWAVSNDGTLAGSEGAAVNDGKEGKDGSDGKEGKAGREDEKDDSPGADDGSTHGNGESSLGGSSGSGESREDKHKGFRGSTLITFNSKIAIHCQCLLRLVQSKIASPRIIISAHATKEKR